MYFCIGSRQPALGGWELHIYKEDVFRSVILQASNLANSKPLKKVMATKASAWYDCISMLCVTMSFRHFHRVMDTSYRRGLTGVAYLSVVGNARAEPEAGISTNRLPAFFLCAYLCYRYCALHRESASRETKLDTICTSATLSAKNWTKSRSQSSGWRVLFLTVGRMSIRFSPRLQLIRTF